jgi:rod shape-determining protein MreC
MAKKKKKNIKKIILVFLIVAVLLGIIRITSSNERTQLTHLEIFLRDAVAPLYSGVMRVSTTMSNISNSITSYNDLLEENNKLKEQVRQLSLQNSQMEEYRNENKRLRQLLDFKEAQKDSMDLMSAKVIGRNISNWFDTIVLDRGTNDGIRKNMPVINHEGLIGRVVAVSRNTSEVMLLLDTESAVGAMNQKTRSLGVIEATTSGEYPLQMIHLTHDAPVEIGDVLITSGLGKIFPKGLKIGYVADIIMSPTGLVKQAMVVPYADFSRLEEVFIVLEIKTPLEPDIEEHEGEEGAGL